MINLKKWMARVSERLAVLNSGYQHKDINITVTKEETVVAQTITLTKGLWVVISYMRCGSSGNGVYVNMIDGQPTRNAEKNGGGNVNVRLYEVTNPSQTVTIYTSAQTIPVTIGGHVSALRLGGVISYLLHLTESLKSFAGRGWAYAEPQKAVNKDIDCADRTASSNTCERCNRMGKLRADRTHGDNTWHNKREYGKRIKRGFSYRSADSSNWMDCGNYFAVCSLSRLYANIKQWSTRGRFRNSCRDKGYSLYLHLLDGSVMAFIPREGVMAC